MKYFLLHRILTTTLYFTQLSVLALLLLTQFCLFLDGACPMVKEWFVYCGNPLQEPDLIQPVQPSIPGRMK